MPWFMRTMPWARSPSRTPPARSSPTRLASLNPGITYGTTTTRPPYTSTTRSAPADLVGPPRRIGVVPPVDRHGVTVPFGALRRFGGPVLAQGEHAALRIRHGAHARVCGVEEGRDHGGAQAGGAGEGLVGVSHG